MIHHTLTDEERDVVSLYTLQALSEADAHEFERHLGTGCPTCRAEVDALRAVAGDIALSMPPIAPPPGLRARVLEAAASQPAGQMAVIRAHEGEWIQLSPGVQRRDLTLTPGGRVFLIRVAAGAAVARHSHALAEHCYVLEGDAWVADEHLGAGDHHIAGPGSVHDGLRSDRGCLLLIADVAA